MTLGLANTTPRPLGWGFVVTVNGMAGPTAVDDIVQVAIRVPGSPLVGPIIAYGQTLAGGSTSVEVLIGSGVGRYFPQLYDQVANGATVTIRVDQFNASFGTVAG